MSGVFKLSRVIRRISGVIPAKLSPCTEKSERYLLSLKISISVGFYIILLLTDELVFGIDLDLSIVLTVSVI